VVLASLGWQLGHGTALQPWPSTLSTKPKNFRINQTSTFANYAQKQSSNPKIHSTCPVMLPLPLQNNLTQVATVNNAMLCTMSASRKALPATKSNKRW